ncbi:hypothetical protein KHO57_gp031 [Mycobacterium phage Phabba]|uniref:Uncharacterized protein n=1 Tax=Mycobacterium phage Phabba TaxID=2027899 RepID=A0A249XSD1_9CAUD|nr:hypothetical protein KHO57_gp031 [Mycobacterium phage Phabba]ASZ74606.1 hypothetical protein SEA_PHABBA_31 [Mycobacterium phage Phabba]
MHIDTTTPGSSIHFCSCHQGFSGDRAAQRLAEHIANPNPNSTAALLQRVLA